MKYIITTTFIFSVALINSQSTVTSTDLIVGLDSFPDSITTNETFIFFNSPRAAFRGGAVEVNPIANHDYKSSALGVGSFAYGINVSAKGDFGTSFGINSQANGFLSFAAGNSRALQMAASALGVSSAEGEYSFAAGSSVAFRNGSTASGFFNIASGINSVALGGYNSSCATGSVSLGESLIVNAFDGTAIGTYNDTLIALQDSIDNSTPLFVVGNGSFVDTSSMIFFARENLLKTPDNTFLPPGITTRSNAFEVFYNGHSVFKPVDAISNVIVSKYREDPESPYEPLITTDSAATGYIGTADLPFNKIYSAQMFVDSDPMNYMTYSDRRLKRNINDLKRGIEVINKIRPVSYNKVKDKSNKPIYGVIAQELESILPELVETDANGIKAVGYQSLIPFLIMSIQELSNQASTQQEEIDQLVKLSTTLLNENQKLKTSIGLLDKKENQDIVNEMRVMDH